MKKIKLLTFVCLPLLHGCATYYEQSAQTDCVTTHWYEEGFDAAKAGRTKAQSWAELVSGCEQTNLWSDRQSYDEGYEIGITKFCTRSNGFEFGQRDRGYNPICPANSQAEFDQAFSDGQRLFNANYNMETAIDNLSSAKSEVSDGEERRRYLAKLIDSGTLDKDTEKKYVKERYSLKYQISSANSSMSGYRSDISRFTREQAALEFQFFKKYYEDGEADTENSSYSAIKTAAPQSIKLNEPAILLYKPEHMDRTSKSHYKKMAKQINKYISSTVDREFRYQVVRDTELVFNPGKANESKTRPAQNHQNPTLLFWDGGDQLNTVELSLELTEPPLVELAQFIQLSARDKILVVEPTAK